MRREKHSSLLAVVAHPAARRRLPEDMVLAVQAVVLVHRVAD
jgi:hypothetical protein